MQRKLILIYVIVTAAFAIYASIAQIQPALYLIDFMAPNHGDKYSLTFVLLITWLIFLLPLIIIQLVSKLIRNKAPEVIEADRTGIFITREKAFQSAAIGIPVYINSKKVGIVDNGKTKFFDISSSFYSLQVGKGKQVSETFEMNIANREQIKYKFILTSEGLYTKVILSKI